MVENEDNLSSSTYEVRERITEGDRVTIKMTTTAATSGNNEEHQLCSYSKASGFGHTIKGQFVQTFHRQTLFNQMMAA